jgi:hypothetical protein
MEDMFKSIEQDETRLIDMICRRLKEKNKQCMDSDIVNELSRMTRDEIIRAIS